MPACQGILFLFASRVSKEKRKKNIHPFKSMETKCNASIHLEKFARLVDVKIQDGYRLPEIDSIYLNSDYRIDSGSPNRN